MTATSDILEANRLLADQINQQALADKQSPYAGRFVGIANGQVVVTSDQLEDAIQQLLQIEPDPQRTFCFEAGVDYSEVQHVWECIDAPRHLDAFQRSTAHSG